MPVSSANGFRRLYAAKSCAWWVGQQELQSELEPQMATNEDNLPFELPQKDKKINLTAMGSPPRTGSVGGIL